MARMGVVALNYPNSQWKAEVELIARAAVSSFIEQQKQDVLNFTK